MRDFASDDLDDLRLLSLDELERVSGGDGEDGDEESPPPPPPVELPPIVVIADPPPPPVIIPPYTPPVDGGGGGGGDPEPNDPPEPPAHEDRIDDNFVIQREGGLHTDGYVPKDKDGIVIDKSGVTIGTGVDLGGQTHQGLINLGLDESLVSMLDPYLGLKGNAAATALSSAPLHISSEQAATLTNAVWGGVQNSISASYDLAAPGLDFYQLSSGAQTVIFSVALQYGPNLALRTPSFWGYMTSGDWQGAYNELMNFGDKYTTRRQAEAALLNADIQAGLLP